MIEEIGYEVANSSLGCALHWPDGGRRGYFQSRRSSDILPALRELPPHK
jgi:hypothetical protein